MKQAYDLHIHSVLSPCSDRLMTPNNISNMAMLKKLDVIAITDHNALFQAPLYRALQESFDYLFLYGAEITVLEGFHVLVYVENVQAALALQEVIAPLLIHTPARHRELQSICNIIDDEVATYPYDLHQPIALSFHKLSHIVHCLGGVVVLAHVDRNQCGIIHKGILLEHRDIDAIEVKDMNNLLVIYEEYPLLVSLPILRNSDAHALQNIHEACYTLELEDKTFASFKKALKS